MKRIASFLICISLILLSLHATGKRVLFIGDSITDGDWGKADGRPSDQRSKTDFNHIYGHGYMANCAAYFQSRYPERQYEFFNRGISGHTVYDLNNRWQKDALDIHPDVISILIGINDIERWLNDTSTSFDMEGWEVQYRQLLDQSRKANPNVRFILCTPFTENTGWRVSQGNFDQRKEALVECVKVVCKLAEEYDASLLRYDMLFDELQSHLGKDLSPEYWIWDSVHPTPAGHQRMAEQWIKAFKKLKVK